MSIKILSKEFRDFDQLLNTPKSFLIGNVFQQYYCKTTFAYSADKEYSLSSSLIVGTHVTPTGTQYLKLTNADGQEWNKIGIKVGDPVSFRYTEYSGGVANSVLKHAAVYSITGSELVLADTPLKNGVMPSVDNGQGDYVDNVYVYSVALPEQIVLSAFHTLNSNNKATASYIDGTAPAVEFNNVDTMAVNSTVSGTLVGNQSGSALHGPFRLRLTGRTARTAYYEVTFNNFILPLAEQSELSNNDTPSQFLGTECLTDRILIEARPDKNNPNITSSTVVLDSLGNTGWFGENFNGKKSDITATVSYTDSATGVALSALNSAGDTDITITVSGLGAFNGATGLCFSLAPSDLSDITFTATGGHENLNIMRRNGVYTGTPPVTSTTFGYGSYSMGNKDVNTSVSGSDLVLTGTLVPSAALQTYLSTAADEDKQYILAISVEDGGNDIADSNKVTVLVDYNAFAEYVAPVGAWGHNMQVLTATQANTESEVVCELDIKTEDIVRLKSNFLIGSTVPDTLIYRFVAYNASTGQSYDLDRIEFDLTQAPTVGGVKQISISQNRGYQVADAEQYTISIERNNALDSGSNYGYTAIIPLLIRYEDWISRIGVPADFYDATEAQNGLNNDWYHFLSTAGWELRLVLNTDVGSDRYEDYKRITHNNYNANSIITSQFAFYRNSDNTQLTGGTDTVSGLPLGVILDEDVRIECTFTRSTGTWSAGDLSNLYSFVRIEVDGGAGHLSQHEINSDDTPLTSSALQPVSGETDLKMELASSTQVKVSCLVKPNNLETESRYKLSARLKCK